MATTRYFFQASQEHFPPEDLLRQAVEAEQRGFDGIASSDHLQPWWEGGQSAHTWPWLGAAGQATRTILLGTGVTPPGARYHPGLIAQAWATLERLFPGRMFLGIGSGEALNEVPVGDPWPSPREQVARMDEALDIIDRLWRGETITREDGFFPCKDLRLHTRSQRRPPIWVSAFGPGGGGGGGARPPRRRLLDAGRPTARARAARRLPRRVRGPRQAAGADRAARRLLMGARRRHGARARPRVEGRPARRRLPRGHPRPGERLRARRGDDLRRGHEGRLRRRRRPGGARRAHPRDRGPRGHGRRAPEQLGRRPARRDPRLRRPGAARAARRARRMRAAAEPGAPGPEVAAILHA